MKCPACFALYQHCPFCKKDKNYIIPETLIIIIQNINQNYTKEQRDNALLELTNQFQYLIKKFTTDFYIMYDLEKKDYDYNDLYQDVLLQFYDLVIKDFKIKQEGEDHLAVFGNYIKTKLYRRVQYGIQEKLKKFGWKTEIEADFGISFDGDNRSSLTREIYEATLANITECKQQEIDSVKDARCVQILKKLYQISFQERICKNIDGEIWRLHWFSGKSVEQIDDYLIMEMSYGCKIGESKIRQIVKKTNQKIIAEFGKLAALGDIDV